MTAATFIVGNIARQAFQRNFRNAAIPGYTRVVAMESIRYGRREPNDCLDFLGVLDKSRSYGASDPRDKIFALISLATDAQKEAVNPGYCMRLDEVYATFAYTMIIIEKDLNILGHCQANVRASQSYHEFPLLPSSCMPLRCLPSWTPDWTQELEVNPFIKNEEEGDTSSRKIYNSSKDYPPCVRRSEDLLSAVIAPIFPCQPVFPIFAFSRVIWTLNHTTKTLLLYHLFSILLGEAISIKQG